MSRLLREIKHHSKSAAALLERAGLRTDSDIQFLTREDLHELFPGPENFKLRRTIFEIIHKKKPVDELLNRLKEFIPHESFRAALTNDGVLVDYLHILKDMKTQMNHVQSFLDAHVSLLEEFSTNQPDMDSVTAGPANLHGVQPDGEGAPGTSTFDEPMESYNGQTDGSPHGASGTSDASGEIKPHTDQTGGHPQGPQTTDGPVESPKGQTDGGPQGAPGTGTSDASGEMKPHTGQTGGHPQGSRTTDGPVESPKGQTDGGPQGAPGTMDASVKTVVHTGQTGGHPQGLQSTGTSDASGEMKPRTGQTGGHPQGSRTTDGPVESPKGQTDGGPQGAPASLKYKMVVSGKTFDTHLELMEKVKTQFRNQVRLIESDQGHNVTFVFCPICSRVASDVEAAMTDVKDDKPVILVLMHHTREAKYTSSAKTWHDDNKVVLFVNVFYHETIHGLLKCGQNDAAVSEIRNELLKRFIPGSKHSRGNARGVGAEGNPSGGGGKDGDSDVDSSRGGLRMGLPISNIVGGLIRRVSSVGNTYGGDDY